MRTLKVSSQGQKQSYAAAIDLTLGVDPGSCQDNSFCGIASRGMQYGVDIFPRGLLFRGDIFEFLTGDSESG